MSKVFTVEYVTPKYNGLQIRYLAHKILRNKATEAVRECAKREGWRQTSNRWDIVTNKANRYYIKPRVKTNRITPKGYFLVTIGE